MDFRSSESVDLDAPGASSGTKGNRDTPGADLYLNNATEGSYLQGLSARGIVRVDTPGYGACESAPYNDEVRPVTAGDAICVHTSEGRYAAARVVLAPTPANRKVILDIVVWNAA